MSSRLDRLKQRKVVEWTLAYLAGAWLVMQLVEVLAGRWPIPLGWQRGIDLSLFAGLFFAVTIAWYHGEKGRQRVSGPELLVLAILLFLAGVLIARIAPSGAVPEQTIEHGPPRWSPPEDVRGIAVLPFTNLSGDPEQQYFVSGMHEALISTLSHIEGLRVISRTSAMRYAQTDRSAPEIGRELHVASLIEGSVNIIGNRVRITVQLIDAGTDDHVWVEEYDRDLRDVLVLMSEVAHSVTEQVQVALDDEEAELLRSAGPVDPELNELFMRGRYAYGLFTGEGIARSVAYFERAIAIDSTFAPAWAGLAGAHVLRAYLRIAPARSATEAADHAVRRALELDPDHWLAQTALGWVAFLRYDWEEMRLAFERALALNPNDPDALHGYADYLMITGREEEGLRFARRARENDPFSPVWGHTVVGHLHMMGRYREAIEEAAEVLELFPTAAVHIWAGSAKWALGRREEALDDFRIALAGRPDLLEALEDGYAEGGPDGAVRAVADAAASATRGSETGAFGVALWYARAADSDDTVAWLERAYEQRAPDLPYAAVRREFDFLRGHAGFSDLIHRLDLPVTGGGALTP